MRLGMEARLRLLVADDYALAMLADSLDESLRTPWLRMVLALLYGLYRHLSLRLQQIVRSPRARVVGEAPASSSPSNSLDRDHIAANVASGIADALRVTHAIALELDDVYNLSRTTPALPSAARQEQFLRYLSTIRRDALYLINVIAAIRDPDLNLDLRLAEELADLASAAKVGAADSTETLAFLTSAGVLTRRLERHLRDVGLRSTDFKGGDVSHDDGE
jgi:hypothetical protein